MVGTLRRGGLSIPLERRRPPMVARLHRLALDHEWKRRIIGRSSLTDAGPLHLRAMRLVKMLNLLMVGSAA
jgi:hypothetical protein